MKSNMITLMPDVCIYHDRKNDNVLLAEVELPGVKKEDSKLDVNENGFCIKAKRDNFVYNSCFQTAHSIEPDKTKAHFEQGLLKLTMPIKSDLAHMRTININ